LIGARSMSERAPINQVVVAQRFPEMKKVVIVGAGISGLSIAYRLQQLAPSVEITLLEANNRPGGTVWTERRDGFQVEIGPNGFLDNKPSTLALCRELALTEQLVSASEAATRNRYLFLQGKLQLLPGGLGAFLKSNLLSWRGKLSFLLERFRHRRRDPADESIAAFARRRAGDEVAEVFADALVTGIHAGDPELLSIRAAFPRIARLEEQYGSVIKGLAQAARQRRAEAAARGEPYQRGGKLWSLRPGLRQLIESLRDRLTRLPVLGMSVRRIQKDDSSNPQHPTWIVSGDGQERWSADAVILACPAYEQATILADLDQELADRVGGIAYNRVAVVALGYRQADVPMSLDGFGYIAPQRTRRDLLGVQWCSSVYPDRAPSGLVLLRAMCGGWHRGEMITWEDARLVEAVRSELRLAMGVTASPLFQHIVRWQRAIPQYHLGHLERIAWIEQRATRLPGLFLGGNAYHGVALNDCTEQAQTLAVQLKEYLCAGQRV
jgi:oxygen-dependent protoporphyrinogen oxidase